jgi:hypothetical protein
MRPVATIPGMWGWGRIKENDAGVEFNYELHKNFCKCHNVLQYNYDKNKFKKLSFTQLHFSLICGR